MSKKERIKMVLAMEFIARQVNNEELFYDWWLSEGVADGDVPYGCMDVQLTAEALECYVEDNKSFAELMGIFLKLMRLADKDGGLYCDGVVSL